MNERHDNGSFSCSFKPRPSVSHSMHNAADLFSMGSSHLLPRPCQPLAQQLSLSFSDCCLGLHLLAKSSSVKPALV
eukprot:1159607-Pelagomonas_calceolata.AAC.10